MAAGLTLLGIETSCDETAAAVVARASDGSGRILANLVLSQLAAHAPYGGVVPEIAARAHVSHLDRLVRSALDEAKLELADLDGIAATAGPGLIGGLLVGLTTAKALALARGLPLVAVNHLEAHALTARLIAPLDFPYLLLLVSGGHTQVQIVEGVGCYRRLGTTIDDALGEAFDKVAKLLGLGYPGGPEVEARAPSGDPARFKTLPRPMKGRDNCDFSFSGLKTAVREAVARLEPLSAQDIADLCAGFEAAIAETVTDRLKRAMLMFRARHETEAPALVVAGGVAANARLKGAIGLLCAEMGFRLIAPPPELCTDNAAMVAWAGAERLRLGLVDGLEVAARPRWPLDPDAAKAPGAGVKA